MASYRVTWEIDIEAGGPLEAAELARHYQANDDSHAVVFDVFDENGNAYCVDLLENEVVGINGTPSPAVASAPATDVP
jgi:hypothetical protein